MRRAVQFLAVLCAAALVVTLCGCGASGSPTAGSVDTAAKPGDGAGIGSPTSGSVHTAAKGGDKGKPPKEPEPGPADPAIAFTVQPRSGPVELWVMNEDGTNRTLLVPNASKFTGIEDLAPTWSPDGQRLAFNNRDSAALEGEGLYVVGLDAAVPQLLVPAPDPCYLRSPAWSPVLGDDRIAYAWSDDTAVDRGEVRAVRVPVAEGEEAQIDTLYRPLAPTMVLAGISWSPDATRLTVTADYGDENRPELCTQHFIGILDLTTTPPSLEDVTWPTFDSVYCGGGTDWARHSDLIAFNGGGLWILDLAESDPSLRFRKLAEAYVGSPSWSPDDSRLVVHKRPGGSHELWIVDLASGAETLLAKKGKDHGGLWEPDWRR